MPPHSQQEFLGPDQKVSVPQASELIGASERALRRTIHMLREGNEPSRASNEWQLPVARAFVEHEKLHLDLTVRGVYEAIGLPSPSLPVRVAQIADVPRKPKSPRNRLDDITEDLSPIGAAADATKEERRIVRDKLVQLKNRTGRPALNQIAAVVEWLRAAGECPTGIFKGVSLASLTRDNLPRFATFNEFLAHGKHDDRWIFVLAQVDSRPIDFVHAGDDAVRYGFILALDLRGYAELLCAAVERERHQAAILREAEELRAHLRTLGGSA